LRAARAHRFRACPRSRLAGDSPPYLRAVSNELDAALLACFACFAGKGLFLSAVSGLSFGMALVRILVDGYSLLHSWPELAPGRVRHSAAAREELLQRLTRYQDAIGTPITVFFDGSGAPVGTPTAHSTPNMEVLYSKAGQTADDMIERTAYRLAPYGEVMAVTDDIAERETVSSMGGLASSCWNFIQTVESTLAELADDIKDYNRRERHRFQRWK